MGINIYYLAEKLITSIKDGHLGKASKVLCGLLGASCLLGYLSSILYLAFRRNKEGTHLLALTGQEGLQVSELNNLPREDILRMQLPQQRTTN